MAGRRGTEEKLDRGVMLELFHADYHDLKKKLLREQGTLPSLRDCPWDNCFAIVEKRYLIARQTLDEYAMILECFPIKHLAPNGDITVLDW